MAGPSHAGVLPFLLFLSIGFGFDALGRANGEHMRVLSRHRRDVPELCLQPMDSGPCIGDFERYYYNRASGHCEQFSFGGCGGNQNHFTSLRSCLWSCERHVIPPVQRRVGEFTSGFCDSVCARGCTCSGTTVRCDGPLATPPLVTTECALTLDLSSSGLKMLRNDSFSRLSNLVTLDLSGNSLRYVPVNTFRGLESLKVLRLSDNQLLQLPALVLRHLPALEELDISSNQLSYMPCEMIDNLPAFTLLNASNNRISRLVAHHGVPLHQMTMDLSSNRLHMLRFPAGQVPKMYLNGNPLQCDCKSKAIADILSPNPSQLLDDPTCDAPAEKSGRTFLEVMSSTDDQACVQEDISDDTRAICMSPLATGPCRALLRRYYYNLDNQRCEAFTYGGCLGTRNNFASLHACQRRCETIGEKPVGDYIQEPTEAPSPACPPGEVFKDCGPACERVCNETSFFRCSLPCIAGCFCQPGHLRLFVGGMCVPHDSQDCRGAVDFLPVPTLAQPITTQTESPPEDPTTQPALTIMTDIDKDKDQPEEPDTMGPLETVPPATFDPEDKDNDQDITTPEPRITFTRLITMPTSPDKDEDPDTQPQATTMRQTTVLPTTQPAVRPTTGATVRPTTLSPTSAVTTDGRTEAPTRPPSPEWPFPPTGSIGPDYIDLNLPAVDAGLLELFSRTPGAPFRFVTRFRASGRVETYRIDAKPCQEYSFIIRRVVSGLPSRRSRAVKALTVPSDGSCSEDAVPQTTEPPTTPEAAPTPTWPDQEGVTIGSMYFDIILPQSNSPGLIYDVYMRTAGDQRSGLYESFEATANAAGSVHRIVGDRPSTRYELMFRTRQGTMTSRESNPLFVTTTAEAPTTRAALPTPVPATEMRPAPVDTQPTEGEDIDTRPPPAATEVAVTQPTETTPGNTGDGPSALSTFTLEWIMPPSLVAMMDGFRVQVREKLANGEVAAWHTVSGLLSPAVRSHDIVFNKAGLYQVRAQGVLKIGGEPLIIVQLDVDSAEMLSPASQTYEPVSRHLPTPANGNNEEIDTGPATEGAVTQPAETTSANAGDGSSALTAYTMEWVMPPSLAAILEGFIVQVREQLANGEFAAWHPVSGLLPADVSSHDIVFNKTGFYQVRTQSFLKGSGDEITIVQFNVDTGDLLPPSSHTSEPSPRHFPTQESEGRAGSLVWPANPVLPATTDSQAVRIRLPLPDEAYRTDAHSLIVQFSASGSGVVPSDSWSQSIRQAASSAGSELVLGDLETPIPTSGLQQVRVLLQDSSRNTIQSSHVLVIAQADGLNADSSGSQLEVPVRLATADNANQLWTVQIRRYRPDAPDAPYTNSIRLPVGLERVALRFPLGSVSEVTGTGNADTTRQTFIVDTSRISAA